MRRRAPSPPGSWTSRRPAPSRPGDPCQAETPSTSSRPWRASSGPDVARHGVGSPAMDDRDLLRTVPIFSELSDPDVASLAQLMTRRKYPKDGVVFFEN